jgi:beta-lactamase regulating signal transducer with metallopeptidase domain
MQPWHALTVDELVAVSRVEVVAGSAVAVVWLTGAAIAATVSVVGWLRSARLLEDCCLHAPGGLAGTPDPQLPRIGRHAVRVLAGPSITSPCCWQFHRPYILLPSAVLAFGEQELGFVLRHEIEHLRQGHPLQLFLQRMVEIVYWFHPLVRWSARQTALVREFACDEAAVTSRSDVAAYLRTLLAVVEQSIDSDNARSTKLGFGTGRSIIARRASRLVRLSHLRQPDSCGSIRPFWIEPVGVVLAAVLTAGVWLPADVLATSRAIWSPWPKWTATTLAGVGVQVRDYEVYDRRTQLFELRELSTRSKPSE